MYMKDGFRRSVQDHNESCGMYLPLRRTLSQIPYNEACQSYQCIRDEPNQIEDISGILTDKFFRICSSTFCHAGDSST